MNRAGSSLASPTSEVMAPSLAETVDGATGWRRAENESASKFAARGREAS